MTHTVTAYLQAGITYSFPARCINHAREIANRIVREGLWVTNPVGEPAGTELFWPTDKLAKVKISENPKPVQVTLPPLGSAVCSFPVGPYTVNYSNPELMTTAMPEWMRNADLGNPSLAAAMRLNDPNKLNQGSTTWAGPDGLGKSGTSWANETAEAAEK